MYVNSDFVQLKTKSEFGHTTIYFANFSNQQKNSLTLFTKIQSQKPTFNAKPKAPGKLFESLTTNVPGSLSFNIAIAEKIWIKKLI